MLSAVRWSLPVALARRGQLTIRTRLTHSSLALAAKASKAERHIASHRNLDHLTCLRICCCRFPIWYTLRPGNAGGQSQSRCHRAKRTDSQNEMYFVLKKIANQYVPATNFVTVVLARRYKKCALAARERGACGQPESSSMLVGHYDFTSLFHSCQMTNVPRANLQCGLTFAPDIIPLLP